jgi:4-amino-4-deoxy-L-arabinose transferase-like glycosyltransferase
MLVLHLLWLGAIVVTGTSTDRATVLLLAAFSAVLGLAIILAPDSAISTVWSSLRTWLYDNRNHVLVLGGLALGAGAAYALLQGPWGDEERSLRVATIVANDGLVQAYVESGWLRNKHPPLMPLVYGTTVALFGSVITPLRLVSAVFLAGTAVAVYLLGRKLYDRATAFLATAIFLLFPLVLRLGSAGMMDIQVTFFFVVSLLLCLRLVDQPSATGVAVCALVMGLGLLTKYTMVLIVGVLIVAVVWLPRVRAAKYRLAAVMLIALSILGGWFVYANHIGVLSDQFAKILDYSGIFHVFNDLALTTPSAPVESLPEMEDVPNLTRNAIFRLGLETLTTRLPSGLGVHLFPVMVAGIGLLFRRRTESDRLLLIWIGVVFVVLFLTLPDHRYFLPAFPAIALLVANAVGHMRPIAERVVLLSAVLGLGNLYLFVDWVRETHLFL